MRYWPALLAFLILSVVLSPGILEAQGINTIVYGDASAGTLGEGAPLAFHVFNGSAADVITARVFGISPGMAPSLSLLGPNQAMLQSSDRDIFLPDARVASISYRLTENGAYTLLVGGTAGDYVLSLDARPDVPATPLALGAPAQVTLNAETPAQSFVVQADRSRSLSIEAVGSPTGPDFVLALREPTGRLAAVVARLDSACLTIPTGEGAYDLTVSMAGEEAEATFAVALSQSPCATAPGQAVTPQQPQQPAVPPVGPNLIAACVVTGSSTVNIRGGAGTNYDIVGTLAAGEQVEVYGQSGTGWYAVRRPGLEGFIASSVVATYGTCNNLPIIQPPANNIQQPQTPLQPTAPPEQPPQQPDQPLPTYTPTMQPDQVPPEYTPTYTPTPTEQAQIAPPDANYALRVDLDSSASISDYVSYPNGDTEDRVSYDVLGLNSTTVLPGGRAELMITASCFGTGTEYVTFFTGGQTFTCGQTVVAREVNFDSKTGSVLISATGGQATYVQWTLNASARRLN